MMSDQPNALPTCPYCGQTTHNGLPFAQAVCPLVAAISYNPDGSVARVEFKQPATVTPAPYYPPEAPRQAKGPNT